MDYPEETGKSKSKIKREFLRVQELGRELVELPEKHLIKFPLREETFDAIRAAKSLNRGARQRQLRYLGGLLVHEPLEAISEALQNALYPDREAVEQFHEIEIWRDKLLADGEPAIDELIAIVPATERQKMRQLIRNSLREQKQGKPPRSARLLFKYLRDLFDSIA